MVVGSLGRWKEQSTNLTAINKTNYFKRIIMRKKGALMLLLLCVMLTSQIVNADDIYERTGQSLFQGGWNHARDNKGYHWTSYWINANASVTAYIKVDGYTAESVTKQSDAKVVSDNLVGPYHIHTHSTHTPRYLAELWGVTEFTHVEAGRN